MRVFVTGATGYIGAAVIRDLVDAGHEVVGLTRSSDGVAILKAAGAEAHRGDLDDLDSLKAALPQRMASFTWRSSTTSPTSRPRSQPTCTPSKQWEPRSRAPASRS